jgi:hypothetical protein
MSRIDFTPAQTTATGVRASSSRSAEMSKLSPAPRCTPPMPPVANTRMPASAAMIIVAATVVAPVWPAATASGRSRRLSLGTAGAGAAQGFDLRAAQPGLQPPVHHGHRGRHRPMGAHLALHLQRGGHVLRIRHAVGNDGRFQRHDGAAGGQRLADLG